MSGNLYSKLCRNLIFFTRKTCFITTKHWRAEAVKRSFCQNQPLRNSLRWQTHKGEFENLVLGGREWMNHLRLKQMVRRRLLVAVDLYKDRSAKVVSCCLLGMTAGGPPLLIAAGRLLLVTSRHRADWKRKLFSWLSLREAKPVATQDLHVEANFQCDSFCLFCNSASVASELREVDPVLNRQKTATETIAIPKAIGLMFHRHVHRRSQGDLGAHAYPKFLAYLVIFCFGKRRP